MALLRTSSTTTSVALLRSPLKYVLYYTKLGTRHMGHKQRQTHTLTRTSKEQNTATKKEQENKNVTTQKCCSSLRCPRCPLLTKGILRFGKRKKRKIRKIRNTKQNKTHGYVLNLPWSLLYQLGRYSTVVLSLKDRCGSIKKNYICLQIDERRAHLSTPPTKGRDIYHKSQLIS